MNAVVTQLGHSCCKKGILLQSQGELLLYGEVNLQLQLAINQQGDSFDHQLVMETCHVSDSQM